jgi:hypothetical protein
MTSQTVGGPCRASKVATPRTPPKPLIVRHEGGELTIEGHPGWLPWKVALRVVATIATAVGALYASGSLRLILGISAVWLSLAVALLIRKSAARTTLALRQSTVRADLRGPLLSRRIEIPLSGFKVQGVSDLYRDEGDQLPIK